MKTMIAAILLVASSIAVAAPGGGSGNSSAGTASTNDVILAGQKANNFVLATGNAQAGANGDSSLFSSSFGGGTWNLLGKIGSTGALGGPTNQVLGSDLTLTFSLANGSKSGTWSITSSKSLQMDLVLGIHAGNATGSFLFDNLVLDAGQTKTGSFAINWNNNGGQVPTFSNLTIFTSNASLRNVAPVPEPSTYAMFLAGLVLVGWMASRRRNNIGTQVSQLAA